MDSMTFIIFCNSLTYCLSKGLIFTIFNKGDLNKNLAVFTLISFIEMLMGEYMQYFSIFLSLGIILYYLLKSITIKKEVDFHSIFLGIVPVFFVMILVSVIAQVIILIINPTLYNLAYNLSVGALSLSSCSFLYWLFFYRWDIELNLSKQVEIFFTFIVVFCIVYQHFLITVVSRESAMLYLIFIGVVTLILVCNYFLLKSEKIENKIQIINNRSHVEELIIENELKCLSLLNPSIKMNEQIFYDLHSLMNLLVERASEMNRLVQNDNVIFDVAVLPNMPKRIALDVYNFFTLSLGFYFCDINKVSKCKSFSMTAKKEANNLYFFTITYEGEKEFSQSNFKNWLSFASEFDDIFISDDKIVGIQSTRPFNQTEAITIYEQKLIVEWKGTI